LNQVLFNDQTLVLPNDMLHKVDLMSMLHSLEVRVPFLDKKVVSIANGMHGDAKYNSKKGKIPLRILFSDLLPESVFKRPKKGFEIPLADVLKNEFGTEIANLKNSTQLMALGLDMTRVKQITSKPDVQLSWHLLVLHHWLTTEETRFMNR
jgi:asparagine synthase (glutamine-hydrolysing)